MGDSKPRYCRGIKCAHCGNKASMEVVATYDQIQSYEDHQSGMQWDAGPIWDLVLCPACSRITLLQTDWHEFFAPDEWTVQVLFPSVDKPLAGLPPEVDKAYQAALKVRHIDSNAFAVLLGRVIDKVCIDRGASGKSLYERLTSLAERGEIPTRLAEMAHQLRQLRNIGAHADLGNLTPAEVPVLDDLCRAILEYVYTAPRLIERVELRIRALKKDSGTSMRPEERRAAKRLKAFLEAGEHTVSYEQGPDPPDIVFHVDGVAWGVEYTQLFQYVDGGTGELPRPSIDAPAFYLEKRLRQRTEGQRKSGWILTLLGPINLKQRRAIEQAAEQAILNDDPSYFDGIHIDEVGLKRVQDDACTIHVISGLSASSRIPGSNRLTADIQGQIDYAIGRILDEKVSILKALSDYDKRVLLIERRYPFGNPSNVAQSIRSYAHPSIGVNLIFLIIGESVTIVGGLDEEFS